MVIWPICRWDRDTCNKVFAKSRLRFGLQVQRKTETIPNFGFKKVCEEQSVNFSVFDRKKLPFEIQIFL